MPRAERAEVVRSGSSMYGSSTGACTGAEPDVPASGIAAAAELKTRCANFGVAANEVERVASSLQLPTNLPQLRASISRAVVAIRRTATMDNEAETTCTTDGARFC